MFVSSHVFFAVYKQSRHFNDSKLSLICGLNHKSLSCEHFFHCNVSLHLLLFCMTEHLTRQSPSWRNWFLNKLGWTDLPTPVTCWYCNQKMYLLPGSRHTERLWYCNLCENTNAIDEVMNYHIPKYMCPRTYSTLFFYFSLVISWMLLHYQILVSTLLTVSKLKIIEIFHHCFYFTNIFISVSGC